MGILDDMVYLTNGTPDASNYARIFGKKVGKPLGYYVDAKPFPTREDAEAARRAGASYDKPYQSMLRGENAKQTPIKLTDAANWRKMTQQLADSSATPIQNDELKDAMMQSQLAANRSPLSALGYDPSRVVYDTQSGSNTNLAGVYLPDRDATAVNFAYGPSTAVHESVHRGLEKLFQNGSVPKELQEWLNKKVYYKSPSGKTVSTDMDEMATRYLMFKAMGNPEMGQGDLGTAEINRSIEMFSTPENLANLMELERLAADAIYKQRPYGGPR